MGIKCYAFCLLIKAEVLGPHPPHPQSFASLLLLFIPTIHLNSIFYPHLRIFLDLHPSILILLDLSPISSNLPIYIYIFIIIIFLKYFFFRFSHFFPPFFFRFGFSAAHFPSRGLWGAGSHCSGRGQQRRIPGPWGPNRLGRRRRGALPCLGASKSVQNVDQLWYA